MKAFIDAVLSGIGGKAPRVFASAQEERRRAAPGGDAANPVLCRCGGRAFALQRAFAANGARGAPAAALFRTRHLSLLSPAPAHRTPPPPPTTPIPPPGSQRCARRGSEG